MKHGSNPRRGRSRGNGKRHPASRSQNFESSGPDVKVRGSAQQVQEKYLNLARDAFSAGDRIAAEGYFQHAEHYYRLANPYTGPNSAPSPGQEPDQGRGIRSARISPRQENEAKGDGPADAAADATVDVGVRTVTDAIVDVGGGPVAETADDIKLDAKPAAKRRGRPRKSSKADQTDGEAAPGGDDAAVDATSSGKKPIPAV